MVWMLINNRVFSSCKALKLLTYVSSQCPERTAVSLVTQCHSSVCAYLSELTRLKDPQVQGSSLIRSCLWHGSQAPRKNSTFLFYKEVNQLMKLNKYNHYTDKPHVASRRSTLSQLLYFSPTVKQMLLSNYWIFNFPFPFK